MRVSVEDGQYRSGNRRVCQKQQDYRGDLQDEEALGWVLRNACILRHGKYVLWGYGIDIHWGMHTRFEALDLLSSSSQ